MYKLVGSPQFSIYPDLWKKDRYRTCLSGMLLSSMAPVDAAIERYGYYMVDADQYGRSYQHAHDKQRTAELDEIDSEGLAVRLILYQNDLDEGGIVAAKEQDVALYREIWRAVNCYAVEGPVRNYGRIDE